MSEVRDFGAFRAQLHQLLEDNKLTTAEVKELSSSIERANFSSAEKSELARIIHNDVLQHGGGRVAKNRYGANQDGLHSLKGLLNALSPGLIPGDGSGGRYFKDVARHKTEGSRNEPIDKRLQCYQAFDAAQWDDMGDTISADEAKAILEAAVSDIKASLDPERTLWHCKRILTKATQSMSSSDGRRFLKDSAPELQRVTNDRIAELNSKIDPYNDKFEIYFYRTPDPTSYMRRTETLYFRDGYRPGDASDAKKGVPVGIATSQDDPNVVVVRLTMDELINLSYQTRVTGEDGGLRLGFTKSQLAELESMGPAAEGLIRLVGQLTNNGGNDGGRALNLGEYTKMIEDNAYGAYSDTTLYPRLDDIFTTDVKFYGP